MRSDLSLIAKAVRLNDKKRKLHIYRSLGLMLLCSGHALAGTGTWTLSTDWTGTKTGNVNAILQDPTVPSQIFISTGNAFGRSFDSGNSWPEEFVPHGNPGTEGKLSGNPGSASVSLAQLPNTPSVMFVGTSGGGIFRTTTGSTQPIWDTLDNATPPNAVSAPSPLSAFPWTRINTPAGSSGVITAITTHRWNPWVAISIAGQGVHVATNALTADDCQLGSYIDTSPSATPPGTGHYCTPSNLNLTWSANSTATSGTKTTLTDATQNWATNIYAGRSLSIVGGANVGETRTIISNTASTLTVAPAFSSPVDNTSIYSLPKGLPNTPTANALVYDPNPGNSNVLYAGLGSKPLWGNSQRTASSGTTTTLTDSGATWIINQWAGYYLRVTGGTNAGIAQQISSNTGNVLTTTTPFPAALDSTSTYVIEGQGLFVSTDNGANWTPASIGSTSASLLPGSFNISALIATSQNGGTVLYAAAANAGSGASAAGVYRGVVNLLASPPAVTWTRIDDGSTAFANIRTLAFDPNTPNKIFAGSFGYGVFSATDNGSASTQSWTDISNGLNSATNSKYVTALSVDALNPSRLYAGTYGGFYTYATYDDQPKTGLISSATSLTFSNTTSSQTITLTNNNSGTTPITFDFSKWSTGAVVSNFKYTHGCPNSLKPGQSCNVTVTYAPSKYATNENGILTITSDDPSSPTTITLQGTSNAALTFTDSSISKSLYFAQTNVGSTSTSQSVVLWNQSLVDDVLSFAFSSTEFTMDGDCLPATSTTTSGGTTTTTTLITSTLPALQSCSLVFAFRPTQAGSKTASLDINGNQKGHLAITLTGGGSGGSTSSGTASVSASLLSFPGVPPHQQSATQSLTLTNTSAQALTISTISTDNSAFIVDSSACPNSLSANASCKILLAYTPVDENPTTSTLTIQTGSSALTVQLSGTSADITSLTASAYGSTASRSLIGNFYFSSREKAKTGNLYIAAEVNGQLYFYDGISWFPWLTGSPRVFMSNATYANQTVNILNRMDTTSLRGVPIYLGFGSSVSDMQKNKTYSPIYILQ